MLLAAAAHAYCPPEIDYSVRGEFQRADYVGVVRVLGVTWLDEQRRPTRLHGKLMLGAIPGGFDPYSGANYRVTPERTFKGTALGSLTIFSENTEGRTPLVIGGRYLVFLERQTASDENRRVGDLMIDHCGNSAQLGLASRAIGVIRRRTDYDDLETVLGRYVSEHDIERAQSFYAAAFTDLGGDGRLEAIVYLSGESWCGTGGCTTLVLARRRHTYAVISKITVTRPPIRLLAARSHGWRDLGVEVGGGGINRPYEAELKFDGAGYPSNPTISPARRLPGQSGTVLIAADDQGRPIRTDPPRRSRSRHLPARPS